MVDNGTKSAGRDNSYYGMHLWPPLSQTTGTICNCINELKLRQAGETGLSGCLGKHDSSVGLGGGDIVS